MLTTTTTASIQNLDISLIQVLGGIVAVVIGAAGILFADSIRPYIPWISDGKNGSTQIQEDTVDTSGDSISVSDTSELTQSSEHGTQQSKSDLDIQGADGVRRETEQKQGDDISVNKTKSSDNGDEDPDLIPDGGVSTDETPIKTAGLKDYFNLRGGSGSDSQQEQTQNLHIEQSFPYPPQSQGSSPPNKKIPGNQRNDILEFNYHPHGVGESGIDSEASRKNQFPIYNVDGEAQIDAQYKPTVPQHWIEVVTETPECQVTLRDGKKVCIDNEASPPRFKPEKGADGIAVGIVVYTEKQNLGYQLIVKPEQEADVDIPVEYYLYLTIVRKE